MPRHCRLDGGEKAKTCCRPRHFVLRHSERSNPEYGDKLR